MAVVDVQLYNPDSNAPSPEIIDVIESGLVSIVRRVEFYEADAETRWFPDPQNADRQYLIDGNVNVDFSSDERRKLDMTLENADKLFRPNSDGGFWYDKVIKVFRGVTFDSRDIQPKVAIIESDDNNMDQAIAANYVMKQAGFTSTDIKLGTSDLAALKDYSWIVSGNKYSPTVYGSQLRALNDAGKNIITFGTANDSVNVPHYTAFNRVSNLLKANQQSADIIDTALGWVAAPAAGSTSVLNTSNPIVGAGSITTTVSAPGTGVAKTDSTATGGFVAPGSGTVVYFGVTVRNDSLAAKTFQIQLQFRNSGGTVTETLTVNAGVSVPIGGIARIFGSATTTSATSTRGGVLVNMLSALANDVFTVDDAWVSTGSPADQVHGLSAPTGSSQLQDVFQPPGTSEADGAGPGPLPTTAASGVQTLAVWSSSVGVTFITAAMYRNANGAVWLDLRIPDMSGTLAKKFFKAFADYVRNFFVEGCWETQLGEFYIDNISEANFPHQMKVTARDATKKMLNDKLSRASTFEVGTRLDDFVIGQAALAGISTKKMRINIGDETLATELSYDKGTPRWDMVKQALNSFNYEFFFDPAGNFVVKPFFDPYMGPINFRFKTGSDGNLVTYEKAINDSRIYNVVQVTAAPNDSDPVPISYFGEARNDDPNSPTNTTRLGNRVMPPIDAPWLTSDEDCEAYAQTWLKTSALESYEINFSAIYYPWLDAGWIIEFLDPDALSFEPTRFLMDTIDYSLGLGPMSATGKRITFVGKPN